MATPEDHNPTSARVDGWLKAMGAGPLDADLRARLLRRAGSPGSVWRLGRYAVLGELARGGMSVVYEGWDPAIRRAVAIKTLDLSELPDEERSEASARFRQELRTLGALHHPSIVTVYDCAVDSEVLFAVLEFVQGQALSERLQEGPLPHAEALRLAEQLAEALHAAHEVGVVHRDVKPANVLLSSDRAVLLDFGIAKTGQVALTRADQLLGTPRYLAPERLAEKSVAIDGRADLFSLGVLLFVCLTGQSPFDGGNTSEILERILRGNPPAYEDSGPLSLAIDQLLQRLLAKDPQDRFPDGRSAAFAIRRILNDWDLPQAMPRPRDTAVTSAPDREPTDALVHPAAVDEDAPEGPATWVGGSPDGMDEITLEEVSEGVQVFEPTVAAVQSASPFAEATSTDGGPRLPLLERSSGVTSPSKGVMAVRRPSPMSVGAETEGSLFGFQEGERGPPGFHDDRSLDTRGTTRGGTEPSSARAGPTSVVRERYTGARTSGGAVPAAEIPGAQEPPKPVRVQVRMQSGGRLRGWTWAGLGLGAVLLGTVAGLTWIRESPRKVSKIALKQPPPVAVRPRSELPLPESAVRSEAPSDSASNPRPPRPRLRTDRPSRSAQNPGALAPDSPSAPKRPPPRPATGQQAGEEAGMDPRCRQALVRHLGDAEATIRLLRRLAQSAPELACAHRALARRLEARDPRASIRHYQEALRLEPDSPAAPSLRRRMRNVEARSRVTE